MKIEQSYFEPVPTGDYQCVVGAVAPDEGQFGPQLQFRFDITAGDMTDRSLMGWCSQKFSPKSKLYKWTRAILGKDIPRGWALDTDLLLDRPVVATVVVQTREDGSEYNKLTDLRPYRNGQNAQRPVSVAPTAAEPPNFPAIDESQLEPPDWESL